MRRLGLGLCALLALGGCDATLQESLDEAQADSVVVALDAQHIGAIKEREEGAGSDGARYRVRVAPDDVARALAVLEASDLPSRGAGGLAEAFGQGSLVPTATEERARYTAALGADVAHSLEAIDGVLSARVHIALPDRQRISLDGPPPRPRASVLLRYRGPRAPYEETQVRALIAGAVQDMQPEDVAVVGIAAPALEARPQGDLTRVGPIAVTRGSAFALKAIGGALLGVIVALTALVVALLVRLRRVPPPEAPPADKR